MTPEGRLVILEYQSKEMQNDLKDINKKLDDLITLRNKGVGAFLVASSLFGTVILGGFWQVIDWLRGAHG